MSDGVTLDAARRLDMRLVLREFREQPPGVVQAVQWSDGAWICATLTASTIVLEYESCGVPVREDLALVSTRCAFGGARRWVRCPTCSARRAVLFAAPATRGRFICRTCLGWPYGSTRERADRRALRRANEIQTRLGNVGAPYWAPLPRPPYQRRSTFERLQAEHRAAVRLFLDASSERMARFESQLARCRR